jgi:hypothetical protein
MTTTIREYTHLAEERAARERSPDPSAAGNAGVHMRHLATEEDHLATAVPDDLDSRKRPWVLLLYVSLAAMVIVFAWMIARG